MQFALLGDHPDGLAMARALVASGRHQVKTYHGPNRGLEYLRREEIPVRRVGDLEEVLADPGVEAVLVASSLLDRPAHLRRALQAERHVLCVHPADQTPDIAYEAAMIQGDTHCVLLPLLPEALHPGVARLAELARSSDGPLGTVRLIEMERMASEAVLFGGEKPSFPGWGMLRALGGEIAEVSAFAAREEVAPEEPLVMAGRFERGGLFQGRLLPGQRETWVRLAVVGRAGRAELLFGQGWPGPARLSWREANGVNREETWEAWDAWAPLVKVFETTLAATHRSPLPPSADLGQATVVAHPSWQEEIRHLELDDAARRSVERRRANTLEYPEATEAVGFKGTMTLVGCSVLWASLGLLMLSRWVPWLGWVIVPVLVLFLALQLLRWMVK